MNREIKFRAKDIDTGKWEYGFYVKREECTPPPLFNSKEDKNSYDKSNTKHYIFSDGFSDWNLPQPWLRTEVDPETIGQYTGLKDKNGKEIYEGDIIQLLGHKPNINTDVDIEQVLFLDGEFCHTYQDRPLKKYWGYAEVIGNIYENPELLQNNQY